MAARDPGGRGCTHPTFTLASEALWQSRAPRVQALCLPFLTRNLCTIRSLLQASLKRSPPPHRERWCAPSGPGQEGLCCHHLPGPKGTTRALTNVQDAVPGPAPAPALQLLVLRVLQPAVMENHADDALGGRGTAGCGAQGGQVPPLCRSQCFSHAPKHTLPNP